MLGVAVAPGVAHELTADIVAGLQKDLNERYSSIEWQTELTVDSLVTPSAPITEIFEAGRRKLLEARWDLGIVVTDLPLRVGRRPVTRRVSTTHRIAIVSLPALGPLVLRSKLRRTLTEVVREFVGSEQRAGAGGPRARIGRRWQRGLLTELTTDTAGRPGGWRILFLPAVLLGNFRLLLGMVRSNRPWRLTIRLYNALVAALATGAFGLVYFDIWRISAAMGWWRLAATSIVSISITTAAIIAVHGLWERSTDPRIRDRVALFNIATTGTVVVGILSLYVILFVLLLAGSALVITPDLLRSELGQGAGALTYLEHAWFVASLATVGGALGASLESDEAIRVAAYASNVGTGVRQER